MTTTPGDGKAGFDVKAAREISKRAYGPDSLDYLHDRIEALEAELKSETAFAMALRDDKRMLVADCNKWLAERDKAVEGMGVLRKVVSLFSSLVSEPDVQDIATCFSVYHEAMEALAKIRG